MFTYAVTIAFVLLVLAAGLAVARVVLVSSIPDRILALDLLVVIALMAIAVEATRRNSGVFFDVLVVISLLGFLTTTAVARFVETRGPR